MHIPELISFVTEPLSFSPYIDIEKASQQRVARKVSGSSVLNRSSLAGQ